MTKKLTREWLQHQISSIEAVGITDSNTLAAFKLALAAMDSEPVAWVSSGTLDSRLAGIEAVTIPFVPGMDIPLFRHPVVTHDGDFDADPFGFARRSGDLVVIDVNGDPHVRDGMPLYRHAQPAQVVPNSLRLALSNAGIAAPESDEMLAATCEKHIQALVTWVKDRKPFQSAPVVPSFEEWLSAANRKPLGWVKDAMREAYDAFRAAMLQAGNSPVIPDGYVMVPVPDEFLSAEQNASGMFELSEDCMCRLAVALSQQSKGLVTPPGYVMVPKEPTDEMISSGIAAHYNRSQIQIHDRPAPGPMECAYVAMLAAADCSIPMISDRWIPVSERMPENDGAYLCWDKRYVTTYAFIFGAWQANQFIAKNITHWMPLPAAPQEVKGE